MKYFKLYSVLIVGLLFFAGSIQIQAQPTATQEQRNEIQGVLDKMKELKKNGKKDDDQAIKDLAKKAIELADKYYKLKTPGNVEGGEPSYDPAVAGEGKTTHSGKGVKVTIGPKAFTSPGWLASTKLHEFVHAEQASDGRWPPPPPPKPPIKMEDIPGKTDAEKLEYLKEKLKQALEELKKVTKANHIREVEAYDREIAEAENTGLTEDELKEVKRRRNEEHYDKLDKANQEKIDKAKANGETYKTAMLPSTGKSMVALARKSELFVAGNVLSEERMLVTFRGPQGVEGNVVSAELNGQTTEAKTDKEGHAILDMSAIASGLVGTGIAIITVFDPKRNQISTATTTVEQGHPMIFNRPVIEQLPANLPSGEVVTIPGQNLGADAHLVIGDQFQETLSASDKEMTVFTDCKTGIQPAFVITANGVSQSQTVNVYSVDFTLPKSSITPKEVVAAQVHYESVPVGTKLIFTNKSPETIKMTIPGGDNKGNECTFTVTDPNGSIPVNITGKTRGNFKIGLDMNFKNDNQTPK